MAEFFEFSSFDDQPFRLSLDGVDVVVHLAAQLQGSWKEMIRANVEFTRRLVEYAPLSLKRFIYISSENVTQGNRDIYSRTKALGEAEAMKFPVCTVLRPTIIYGPDDRKYVGRMASIIRRCPIVPILGRGDNRFQFIHVDDVATIVEQSIVRGIAGTYTIAGPDVVTYDEFVQILMEEMSVRKPVIHLPLWGLKPVAEIMDLVMKTPPLTPSQLANLTKDRCYDITGLARMFDYTPTSLRAGLATCVTKTG